MNRLFHNQKDGLMLGLVQSMPLSKGKNDVGGQLDCTTTGNWSASGANITKATTESYEVRA